MSSLIRHPAPARSAARVCQPSPREPHSWDWRTVQGGPRVLGVAVRAVVRSSWGGGDEGAGPYHHTQCARVVREQLGSRCRCIDKLLHGGGNRDSITHSGRIPSKCKPETTSPQYWGCTDHRRMVQQSGSVGSLARQVVDTSRWTSFWLVSNQIVFDQRTSVVPSEHPCATIYLT